MEKPFKTYFGGKESPGVYQTIINHIRPHNYFAEPFGGNYSISRKINDEAIKCINDINPDVYSMYGSTRKGWHFYNMDYRSFCDGFLGVAPGSSRVIYFDPPYPLTSIKSERAVYPFSLSDQDHIDFLSYANSIKAKADILISTFPNEIYKEKLREWYLVEFEGWSRHGKTTEWLFLNYNPTKITKLHDGRYYGSTYTERQRIARSIRNTVRKVLNHPDPIIRNEILKQIHNST